MKELSTEEKAKRYDKVIERATKHRNNDGLTLEQYETIDIILPELKESEYERIRKALVEMVHDTTGDSLWVDYNVHKEDALAWLEKQGEHKPAWSEEDEKMVGNIRSIIEKYAFSQSAVDVNGELCEKEYIEADNWLKSIKDRVQPQPKQKWSEEDNQYLCGLIGLIEQSKAELPITLKGKAADNCINWLKSLRPPQWRRLPLNGVSYAPDYWCVMDVITSTVGANSASVSALVKGDYYVPLFELEKFIRNI